MRCVEAARGAHRDGNMLGMATTRSVGRQFGRLWAAFAVSTFGTWIAFDALPLIAILVLRAGPTEVSMLAAAGLAVGAAVAIPLGPWVEFRRKRPVMVAMDLIRFAALISIPAAFALGWLSFAQLLVVSVVVGAANIAFRAASGAFLKTLVRPEDLLVANGRFESTTWHHITLRPHSPSFRKWRKCWRDRKPSLRGYSPWFVGIRQNCWYLCWYLSFAARAIPTCP